MGPALHGGSRSGRRTHRRDRRSPGRITSAAELSQPSWSPIAQPRKQGHWHALGDLQRRVAIAVGSSGAGGHPGCLARPRHDVLRDIGREADEHGPIGRPVLTWGRTPPLGVSASRQQRRTAERRPSCRPSPESDSQHRRRAFLGRPPGCVTECRPGAAGGGRALRVRSRLDPRAGAEPDLPPLAGAAGGGAGHYRRERKVALYSLTERESALLDLAGVAGPAATVRG